MIVGWQFSWPTAKGNHSFMLAREPMHTNNSLPLTMEVREHKAPGPVELLPSFLEVGGEVLKSELENSWDQPGEEKRFLRTGENRLLDLLMAIVKNNYVKTTGELVW